MDGNIFISYRRGPDSNAAGRLYDRLERNFPPESLFFDIDSIPIGVDFAQHIQGEVEKCDVQLVVIGPGWLENLERLQSPDDFVRLEIEAALERSDIPVVPLLFDGAQMPTRDDLPDSLHPLVRRNAIMVSHTQFAQIVDGRLTVQLKEVIAQAAEAQKAAEAALAQAQAERARQLAERVREEQLKLQKLEQAEQEERDRAEQAKSYLEKSQRAANEQRERAEAEAERKSRLISESPDEANDLEGKSQGVVHQTRRARILSRDLSPAKRGALGIVLIVFVLAGAAALTSNLKQEETLNGYTLLSHGSCDGSVLQRNTGNYTTRSCLSLCTETEKCSGIYYNRIKGTATCNLYQGTIKGGANSQFGDRVCYAAP